MAKEPAKSADRAKRLARALKANLARRKAQGRARQATLSAKTAAEVPKPD
ncbi:MAG: hypothetical protein JNM20_03175 [Rhizobiales bacterium]|nr:hypothetical protein [Hyphomicrobiales bacterium]